MSAMFEEYRVSQRTFNMIFCKKKKMLIGISPHQQRTTQNISDGLDKIIEEADFAPKVHFDPKV